MLCCEARLQAADTISYGNDHNLTDAFVKDLWEDE